MRGRINLPDAVLRAAKVEFGDCVRRGAVRDLGFAGLETHVAALCAVQVACERIRAMPTPFACTLLLHRTARLFCLLLSVALVGTMAVVAPLVAATLAYAFFGLDGLGGKLEGSFALWPNTLPPNARVRLIEVEVPDGLGETNLPSPVRLADTVLQ